MEQEARTSITVDLGRLADALSDGSDGMDERFQSELAALTDETASQMEAAILESGVSPTEELIKSRAGFESRLLEIWQPALEIFDLVQAFASEIGGDINLELRPRAAARQDYLFEALVRLHGRACLTSSEIGALLRSGHATGANGRWRTLNELAVVIMFIAERGEDVAHRYLEHQAIESYRSAVSYQAHAERNNAEPFSTAELAEMKEEHDGLVQRYGKSFKTVYGWASAELGGHPKPTFQGIVAALDLEHWRPYYNMANLGIHAGSSGSYFDIGHHSSLNAIPAGPSQFGLADPGGSSLISLTQATVPLMAYYFTAGEADGESGAQDGESREHFIKNTVLMTARMKLLMKLMDRGGQVFVEIQDSLDEDGWSISDGPRVVDIQ